MCPLRRVASASPDLGYEGVHHRSALVRRYYSAGNILWTRQFDSPSFDQAWGVAADAAGAVYVAGWTDRGFGQKCWAHQPGGGGMKKTSAIHVVHVRLL